jgi:hypothetical protein
LEVPIDAGGKIAGHAAGFDLGMMDVKTRAVGPNPDANYSVVRVKRSPSQMHPNKHFSRASLAPSQHRPSSPTSTLLGFPTHNPLRKNCISQFTGEYSAQSSSPQSLVA